MIDKKGNRCSGLRLKKTAMGNEVPRKSAYFLEIHSLMRLIFSNKEMVQALEYHRKRMPSLFWHAKEFTGLMPALGNLKESELALSQKRPCCWGILGNPALKRPSRSLPAGKSWEDLPLGSTGRPMPRRNYQAILMLRFPNEKIFSRYPSLGKC